MNNVDKIGAWQKKSGGGGSGGGGGGGGGGGDGDGDERISSRMKNIRRVFGEDVTALSWALPAASSVGLMRKREGRYHEGITVV